MAANASTMTVRMEDEPQPDGRQRARMRAGRGGARARSWVCAVGRDGWAPARAGRRARAPGHARDAAPRNARTWGSGGPRSGHGCWGPRLGFVFDQFAMVSAVEPSSLPGSGALST
jgi:hypothetical protein